MVGVWFYTMMLFARVDEYPSLLGVDDAICYLL